MSDGPYQGSIRDNTPSGLQGLFNLISLLGASLQALPQLLEEVISINQKLQYLVGFAPVGTDWLGLPAELRELRRRITFLTGTTDFPANDFGGLPSYLPYVLGSPLERYNVSNSVLLQLTRQLAAINEVSQNVDGVELYTQQIAIATGNPGAGAGATSLLAQLLLIEDNTRRSAVCCETGLIPPVVPPAPTNAAPAGFCSLFPDNAVRNMGYTVLAPNQYDLAPRQAYGILWPVFPQISTIESAPPNAPNLGFRGLRSANALDYCLAWNFTGGAVPGQARLHRTNEVWSGDSADGSTTVINLSMQGATALGTGSQDYFGFVIILEAGEPLPANNFFLRYGQTGTA